jgi:hypothetical protein
MDIFNRKKVDELSEQNYALKFEIDLLKKQNHLNSVMPTLNKLEHIIIQSKTIPQICKLDKIQYELDYPRKHNLGSIYKKVFKCNNIKVITELKEITLTCGAKVKKEVITGRTYYFINGNENINIFEPFKG